MKKIFWALWTAIMIAATGGVAYTTAVLIYSVLNGGQFPEWAWIPPAGENPLIIP